MFRLRYILHQLNRGELPIEDLKRNIEYAALVLETAYMDETRLATSQFFFPSVILIDFFCFFK